MEPEKTVLLEAGFDALHGISWTKGCYMGQELTARTRYRGLLKRRLMQVTAAEPLPPPGTKLVQDDREMGEMRSSQGGIGLALLRLEAEGATLLGAGTTITARMQDWAKTPEPA
jgi:folate-binding protein YgfZ